MGLFSGLFSKENSENDDLYLRAEPIPRKRMDLLWLDPPRLAQLELPIKQHKIISIVLGPNASSQREHDIDEEDFSWAKQIEKIVDKAYEAGQHGRYKDAVKYYKEALDLAPGCDLFLMSIGTAYAQMGQKAKAVMYLERAAEISPDNNRIRDNLQKIK